MKIKKSFALLLSLFTAGSFTCSEVFASRNSIDDMSIIQRQKRRRHNAIFLPRMSEVKPRFTAYKEEQADFALPGMKKVTINNGVRTIDESAFFERDDIDEVVIPESVEKINDYAFIGCKNLKRIVIQGEVSIGQCSFSNCENLVELLIDGKIKDVTATSFYECNNLRIIRDRGQATDDNVMSTIAGHRRVFFYNS